MAFTEIEQVSQLVESILPEKGIRHKCLCIFADSIVKLNDIKPALWGVHCAGNNKDRVVRLYAGKLIVLTLEKGRAWLPLDQISLEESPEIARNIEDLPAWEWDKEDSPEYKQVLSKNGFYTPLKSHEDDWPLLKPFHFAFLDRVAKQSSALNISSRRLDEPVVTMYLKHELNRNIPSLYVQPENVDRSEDRYPSNDFSLTEEVELEKIYEGSVTQIKVNKYERNPKARKECLEHYGARCVVCDFAFAEKYGPSAAGFMVVHHLTPLSATGERYEVDPIKDLKPVCPNCHAVIHKKVPPFTIEEMQEKISKK